MYSFRKHRGDQGNHIVAVPLCHCPCGTATMPLCPIAGIAELQYTRRQCIPAETVPGGSTISIRSRRRTCALTAAGSRC